LSGYRIEENMSTEDHYILRGIKELAEYHSNTLHIDTILQAIDAEPELDDEIPPELESALKTALEEKDIYLIARFLHLTVKLTKQGIKQRILEEINNAKES